MTGRSPCVVSRVTPPDCVANDARMSVDWEPHGARTHVVTSTRPEAPVAAIRNTHSNTKDTALLAVEVLMLTAPTAEDEPSPIMWKLPLVASRNPSQKLKARAAPSFTVVTRPVHRAYHSCPTSRKPAGMAPEPKSARQASPDTVVLRADTSYTGPAMNRHDDPSLRNRAPFPRSAAK